MSCEEFGKNKPDPTVFLKCMERLGCTDYSECVIFEDSVRGLTAAHNAQPGKVICILSNKDNLEKKQSLATHVVNDYTELL